MGIGIRGIGMVRAIVKGVAYGGLTPWDFDPLLVSFTPGMAKRATSVFAASPIVQGMKDGTGTPDVLSLGNGTTPIAGSFYPNFDPNQGSISLRWIPEYSSGGIATNYHYLYYASATYYVAYDYTNARYHVVIGSQTLTVASAVVAGTAINLCFAWDVKNTLDGTNYCRVSINDTHTFGIATAPTLAAPSAAMYIGTSPAAFATSGIIEGLTIYRRVLYDGTYGVNVGNGDEVNLISAGIDPCTVTGSWDVCFCLPTNATPGALVTGTGEAWSHPHSSNLLTRGFLSDRYYGGSQWGLSFNGTSTYIDCGSGATLDDLGAGGAIFQVELWARPNYTATTQTFIRKGNLLTTGWLVYAGTDGRLYGAVKKANTDTTANSGATMLIKDGKWHHLLFHYNDTTAVAQVAVDGVWGTAGAAGDGAYISDAASNLIIGRLTNLSSYFDGSMGWINIHNDAHYTPGTNFLPPRALPAADVEEWALNEGTGVTATAVVTTPGCDGTITDGTWEPQWYAEGTPVILQSVVGSASYRADLGSAAELDDLADNAFTIDGWFRSPKLAGLQYICHKGTPDTNGWYLQLNAGLIYGLISCATTSATSYSTARYDDNLWHYFKMTFDDAGDRKIDLFIDNVEVTYGAQVAGDGAIVSDAAGNGSIGRSTGSNSLTGAHGWIRWSNVVRGAGMIPRSNPPDPADANTIGQWNADEGAGAVLTDLSGEGNNGAMSGTYSWNNSPAMESDSPGARNYAWGYVFGNDAADEGFKQTWAGLTAGKDYVIRALAYSEDGVGQPEMIVYDETNAAILKTMTAPWNIEKCANGDFALGDVLWGHNAEWSIAAGVAHCDGTQIAYSYFQQALVVQLNGGVEVGRLYKFTYTLDNWTAGTIQCYIAGALNQGTIRSSDGTYTEIFRANGTWIGFEANADFIGDIDDVSVTPISDELHPDLLMCSFELPTIARGAAADCVSISVKIINTVATGVVGFQQVELLANLLDNPSFDTGAVADPWIPYGWTNTSIVAGESTQSAVAHSGANSYRLEGVALSNHSITQAFVLANLKYVDIGYWQKRAVADAVQTRARLNVGYGVYQATLATLYELWDTNVTSWTFYKRIARIISANPTIYIQPTDNLAQDRDIDDIYAILCDDVSLTVTPASAANSVESGGIRVDGVDQCTQPIPVGRLFATQGWMRFKWIPRHGGVDVLKFGCAIPVIAHFHGDANNYTGIYWSGAGTLTLYRDWGGVFVSGNWVAVGAIVAGTTYLIEIKYDPSGMYLYVDSILRITLAAGLGYGTVPSVVYIGTNEIYAVGDYIDSVFLAP